MWFKFAKFILRYRTPLLIFVLIFTAYTGYLASKVEMSYEKAKIVPKEDVEYQNFEKFIKHFGNDGNVIVVGVETKEIFNQEFFNDWFQLGQKLRKIPGVTNIVSVADLYSIDLDTADRKFKINKVCTRLPESQEEVNNIREKVLNNRFFEGLVYDSTTNSTLIAIDIDRKMLDSKERIRISNEIMEYAQMFEKEHNLELHYSGLPLIRTLFAEKVKGELYLFSGLAIAITAVLLWFFFRSALAVIIPTAIVLMGGIWTIGSIAGFGYKITILTGLIPPLIVVIGVPNCIYLVNKYHLEYRKHGNKILALTRLIEKTGASTFIANVTTAIGFGVFIPTSSNILSEFGVVSAINTMLVWLASLVLVPAIYSFLPAPSHKQTDHLDNKYINQMIDVFGRWAIKYRPAIYISTIVITVISGYGMYKLKPLSFLVDDLPQKDKLYTDLKFFEKRFHGLMPFEILVETGQKGGALDQTNLEVADQIQQTIGEYKEFSRPVSLVEIMKACRQAYKDGDPNEYELFSSMERGFILPMLSKSIKDQSSSGGKIANAFTDSTRSMIRLSYKMADVGTVEMKKIKEKLRPQIDSIVKENIAEEDTAFHVTLTGSSVVFLEGNQYIIDSLYSSIWQSYILIAIVMLPLFRSMKLLIISLIPNTLPMIWVAGFMGFYGIPLKPSTVLVFSIALGIAVDCTTHFLVKYRQEIERHDWDIYKTVLVSLQETGSGMIYTSVIIFFGFAIFGASQFEGTVALGVLTSVTILVSMFANLIMLPALIYSFGKINKIRRFTWKRKTE